MAITTPDAVPGEVIEAAWGDAVRADLTTLDTTKLPVANPVATGSMKLRATGATVQFHFQNTSGTDRAAVTWWDAGNVLQLSAPTGAGIGFVTEGTTKALVNAAGYLLVGKATNGEAIAGFEVQPAGTAYFTHGALAQSVNVVKVGTAAVAGQNMVLFKMNAAVIGSIWANTLTSVAYATTSDKRLKSLVGPLDGDEALATLNATEPVQFTFNEEPEAGVRVGFFAQDLQAVMPDVVSPGEGEPDDEDFRPWMVDHSGMVPTLVAAVQGLSAQVAALEARVAALEAT